MDEFNSFFSLSFLLALHPSYSLHSLFLVFFFFWGSGEQNVGDKGTFGRHNCRCILGIAEKEEGAIINTQSGSSIDTEPLFSSIVVNNK